VRSGLSTTRYSNGISSLVEWNSTNPREEPRCPEIKKTITSGRTSWSNRQARGLREDVLRTFGIVQDWVETVLRKAQANVTPDKRGSHDNRPQRIAMDVATLHMGHQQRPESLLTLHVIPRQEGIRQRRTVASFRKLLASYLAWTQKQNLQKAATLRQCRDIFCTEFNNVFWRPKKGLCNVCHRWKTRSRAEGEVMIPEYRKHQSEYKRIKKGRTSKTGDRGRAGGKQERSVPGVYRPPEMAHYATVANERDVL